MKRLLKILIFISLFFSSLVLSQYRGYEAMKRQGISHMDNGKFGEAIDLFNKYIANNAQESEGYNLRGLCHEKRQIYKYAVLDFRRAIHLTSNDVEYRENLSRVISIWYPILRKKIEGHKREIAIDPTIAVNYLEIGKSHRWLEEWSLAELWYDRYLERDDDASPDEIIRYSIILTKTGHIKKGEIILKKWVDRYPDDWRLWSRYGYFTLWLGNRDNAANAFTVSLGFKPFFKEAQDGLDIATEMGYMIKNEPRAYERRYAGYPIDVAYRKLRKTPSDSETRFELIALLIDINRIEEARDQLNILKDDYSEDIEYIKLDEQLTPMLEEKYSSLLEESIAKLKKDPDNKYNVKEVADYYTKLQQYDEANEIMEEYLEMHSQDIEMREYYADILAHSGDFFGGAEILSELTYEGYATDAIVEKAANYYGNDFEYDNSIRVLNDYIEGKSISEAKDFTFMLAKYYAWNYQWDDSRDQIEQLLEVYPDNNEYKLFASQLIVWTVDDTEFDTAAINFEEVLLEDPDNVEALVGLATIHSWRREHTKAKALIDRAYEVSPDNTEILSAESFYNAQLALEDDRLNLEKRGEIGELVKEEDYDGALDLFDEYFEMDDNPSRQVYHEYAQISLAAGDYNTAISVYDDLLEDEYEEEIAIDRANAHLWNGDSLIALNQFLELSENDPENYNAKMGLANSYVAIQEYGDADDIYDELIDETEDSVQVAFIKQKQDMLPMYGVTAGLNSAFQFILPTNISIIPSFAFYVDNQELTYYQYGVRAEVGMFRYFTIGGSWLRTDIHSLTNSQTLTELSGQLYFHPFQYFSIGGSLGRLNIERELQKNVGTLEARWFSEDLLLRIGYRDTDARLLLISPDLLDIRLDAYVYNFSGNYRLKDKYKFLIFYQYFSLSDGNIANDFRFRFGKAFRENLFLGYEYFFSDYGFLSFLYYSPQDYSTHSIWVDYEYNEIKNLNLVVGGQIGYAPSIDFIVGNVYVDASYRAFESLILNGRATYGHSYRFNSSYQSLSIILSAHWSIW